MPENQIDCVELEALVNPMNSVLEARLRICYPHGLFSLFDNEQANIEPARSFWQRLPVVLAKHGLYCTKPSLWSGYGRVVEFDLYRNGDPECWYFNDNKTEKIAELKQSGQPFVQIQALVSTVTPALYLNIQETWFNPDTYGDNATGRYDDGLKTQYWLRDSAYQPWSALIADLRLTGAELKLDDFDESTLKQDVGFITSPVFTDDDDDLDDDYSQETEIAMLKNLEQETCCLYDCLFNSYR